jgi:hypothetical protein
MITFHTASDMNHEILVFSNRYNVSRSPHSTSVTSGIGMPPSTIQKVSLKRIVSMLSATGSPYTRFGWVDEITKHVIAVTQ